MLSREEAEGFVADGLSAERRQSFREANAAVRAWRADHAASLDDVIDFIMALQEIFGPFAADRPPTVTRDMRL